MQKRCGGGEVQARGEEGCTMRLKGRRGCTLGGGDVP